MDRFTLSGNIVDLVGNRIFPGKITVESGIIQNVEESADEKYSNYLMPGLIDSHVHIESSMMLPSEFARLAAVHGTVATVSDPHEIANVLGKKGVLFMLDNSRKVPFKFYFGAPSCVPATHFETSGAELTTDDIRDLMQRDEIKYLSEMMNYPGVLMEFKDVKEKLKIAKQFNKPIDGHAPGLKDQDAKKYIEAGISTDHECITLDEASDKIYYGMKILIREGSAAKNFEELYTLIDTHTDSVMLCSDDKHPDDLVLGHINVLVKRALDKGIDLLKVLRAAVMNPIKHYKLDCGLLQAGDPADIIEVYNPKDFNILRTYINGTLVAENGKSLIESIRDSEPNYFNVGLKVPEDFRAEGKGSKVRVIEAVDHQLFTNEIIAEAKVENGNIVSNTENDILKFTVVNRYKEAPPAVGFIKNFGLKQGAIASSVAHDSHNIIAVGTNDELICKAVNAVIKERGGMAAVDEKSETVQALPVAGLMGNEDGYKIAQTYAQLDKKAKEFGSTLEAPFMTLSFMALLVIPKLKLSDKGLFNGEKFEFTDLCAD